MASTAIFKRGKFLGQRCGTRSGDRDQEAIKHFEITDPEQQKRLIARSRRGATFGARRLCTEGADRRGGRSYAALT